MSQPTVFDLHETPEMISIVLNSKHPLFGRLNAMLTEHGGHKNGGVQATGVHVLLEAWARLENASGGKRRQLLEDIRLDWGRVARDIVGSDLLDSQ